MAELTTTGEKTLRTMHRLGGALNLLTGQRGFDLRAVDKLLAQGLIERAADCKGCDDAREDDGSWESVVYAGEHCERPVKNERGYARGCYGRVRITAAGYAAIGEQATASMQNAAAPPSVEQASAEDARGIVVGDTVTGRSRIVECAELVTPAPTQDDIDAAHADALLEQPQQPNAVQLNPEYRVPQNVLDTDRRLVDQDAELRAAVAGRSIFTHHVVDLRARA